MGTDADAIRKWQEDHADELFVCDRFRARITVAACGKFQTESVHNINCPSLRTELHQWSCHGCERATRKNNRQPHIVKVFKSRRSQKRIFSKLQQARVDIGMSQIDLAERLHVSYPMYGKYERGDYPVPFELQERLAAFFGRPWSELEGK